MNTKEYKGAMVLKGARVWILVTRVLRTPHVQLKVAPLLESTSAI